MARSNRPEAERRDFHLFVDEFQNFATDSFASILAEARKYRLSLTLSHQYIDQLIPSIRSAVFGNVGNLISFRVGFTDAEILAAEFGNEFNPSTFVDLPRFHASGAIRPHRAGRLRNFRRPKFDHSRRARPTYPAAGSIGSCRVTLGLVPS